MEILEWTQIEQPREQLGKPGWPSAGAGASLTGVARPGDELYLARGEPVDSFGRHLQASCPVWPRPMHAVVMPLTERSEFIFIELLGRPCCSSLM